MSLRNTRQSTDVFGVLTEMAKLANMDDNQFQAFRNRLSSVNRSIRSSTVIPSLSQLQRTLPGLGEWLDAEIILVALRRFPRLYRLASHWRGPR
jgi:hypothetical protein